ncbi:hypothetical protein ACE6H2_027030 [Prunus campanulata]
MVEISSTLCFVALVFLLKLPSSKLHLQLQNLLPSCRIPNWNCFPRSKAHPSQIAIPFASLSPPFQLLLLILYCQSLHPLSSCPLANDEALSSQRCQMLQKISHLPR